MVINLSIPDYVKVKKNVQKVKVLPFVYVLQSIMLIDKCEENCHLFGA